MQRLSFSKEGKIIAYCDNGYTDGVNPVINIRGDFTVGEELAKYIIAKQNGIPVEVILDTKVFSGKKVVNKIFIEILDDDSTKRLNDEREEFLNLAEQRQERIEELEIRCNDLERKLVSINSYVERFNDVRRFTRENWKFHF